MNNVTAQFVTVAEQASLHILISGVDEAQLSVYYVGTTFPVADAH